MTGRNHCSACVCGGGGGIRLCLKCNEITTYTLLQFNGYVGGCMGMWSLVCDVERLTLNNPGASSLAVPTVA